MKKDGYSTIEMLMWALGASATLAAYAHSTFITYREVAPRLDKIETKIDLILEKR